MPYGHPDHPFKVMATAAALIAAKKAKDKEAAMRAEAEREHRRQMQQREMTPDNLKIVEQKLLEFQQQQQEDVCVPIPIIFYLLCQEWNE